MIFKSIFYSSLAVLILTFPSHAQEEVSREVIACGGASVSGGGFALSHTIGQNAPGEISGGDHIEQSGFWYMYRLVVTGVEDAGTPAAFRLYQNFPNPFNPVTTIRFSLPRRSRVSLKIYDVAGSEVMTVIDGYLKEGIHEIPVRADGMASGVYFYRLRAGSDIDTRKMVMIR